MREESPYYINKISSIALSRVKIESDYIIKDVKGRLDLTDTEQNDGC